MYQVYRRGCFSPFLFFDSGSHRRGELNAFSVSTEGTHHTVVIHVQRKDPRGDFHRFRFGENWGEWLNIQITKYLKKSGWLVAGFNPSEKNIQLESFHQIWDIKYKKIVQPTTQKSACLFIPRFHPQKTPRKPWVGEVV